MISAVIKQLKDKLGNAIVPITHEKAIVMTEGGTLGDKLTAIDSGISTVEQKAIATLTHSKSGTVHALTGLSGKTGLVSVKFKATAAFAAGDSFKVDGVSYTAKQANGKALAANQFVSGAAVDCLLDTAGKTVNFKGGGGYGTLPGQSGITLQNVSGGVKITITRPNAENYTGTLVVRKIGNYPAFPEDGVQIDVGVSTAYTDNTVADGTTYFYRAFAYNANKEYQTLVQGAQANINYIKGTPISELPLMARIKIPENDVLQEFYIVKHDAYTNGQTLILRRYTHSNCDWSSLNVNAYAGCTLDLWLNNDYFNTLHPNIKKHITAVSIPYTPGNGNNNLTSLSRKIFVVSATELGVVNQYLNSEGSFFSNANAFRIATDSRNNPKIHWTRSPYTGNNINAWIFNNVGEPIAYSSKFDGDARPAFTIPNNLIVSITPDSDGAYKLIL